MESPLGRGWNMKPSSETGGSGSSALIPREKNSKLIALSRPLNTAEGTGMGIMFVVCEDPG